VIGTGHAPGDFPSATNLPPRLSISRMRSQEQRTGTSGLEGLADVRIIQAIYQSVDEQQTVALPPLVDKRRPSMDRKFIAPLMESQNGQNPISSGEAA